MEPDPEQAQNWLKAGMWAEHQQTADGVCQPETGDSGLLADAL